MFVFLIENLHCEPINKEPEKHNDMKWFTVDKLPTNTMPFTKEAIKAYINKISYSKF